MARLSRQVLAAAFWALLVFVWPSVAVAQQRLGYNLHHSIHDVGGSGEDQSSRAAMALWLSRGVGGLGRSSLHTGDIVAYRFRRAGAAQSALTRLGSSNPRHSGPLNFGAHTQLSWHGTDVSLAANDLAKPEEAPSDLRLPFGLGEVGAAGFEIDHSVQVGATLEFARRYRVNHTELRPFVGIVAGQSMRTRVGADLSLYGLGTEVLGPRDPLSGRRYRNPPGQGPAGLSVRFGIDAAYLADTQDASRFTAPDTEDPRYRVRAGLRNQERRGSVLYGATYLWEAHTGHPESEVIGGITARLNF